MFSDKAVGIMPLGRGRLRREDYTRNECFINRCRYNEKCLLHDNTKGEMTEVQGVGRRSTQLLDDLRNRRTY